MLLIIIILITIGEALTVFSTWEMQVSNISDMPKLTYVGISFVVIGCIMSIFYIIKSHRTNRRGQ